MSRHSVMEYFGRDDTGSRCGYCKSPESSLSDGKCSNSCELFNILILTFFFREHLKKMF